MRLEDDTSCPRGGAIGRQHCVYPEPGKKCKYNERSGFLNTFSGTRVLTVSLIQKVIFRDGKYLT